MATITAELPRYFTARQVAKALRMGENRTLALIREGRIRAIRVGRTIRVSEEALREFENSGQEPNPAVPAAAEERVNGAR